MVRGCLLLVVLGVRVVAAIVTLSSLSLWVVVVVATVIIVIEGSGGWHRQWWVVDAVRGCLPLTMLGVVAMAIIVTGGDGV